MKKALLGLALALAASTALAETGPLKIFNGSVQGAYDVSVCNLVNSNCTAGDLYPGYSKTVTIGTSGGGQYNLIATVSAPASPTDSMTFTNASTSLSYLLTPSSATLCSVEIGSATMTPGASTTVEALSGCAWTVTVIQ